MGALRDIQRGLSRSMTMTIIDPFSFDDSDYRLVKAARPTSSEATLSSSVLKKKLNNTNRAWFALTRNKILAASAVSLLQETVNSVVAAVGTKTGGITAAISLLLASLSLLVDSKLARYVVRLNVSPNREQNNLNKVFDEYYTGQGHQLELQDNALEQVTYSGSTGAMITSPAIERLLAEADPEFRVPPHLSVSYIKFSFLKRFFLEKKDFLIFFIEDRIFLGKFITFTFDVVADDPHQIKYTLVVRRWPLTETNIFGGLAFGVSDLFASILNLEVFDGVALRDFRRQSQLFSELDLFKENSKIISDLLKSSGDVQLTLPAAVSVPSATASA